MIVMYALLVTLMAATELALLVRVMPGIRQSQSKVVARLFLWVAIIPGELVVVAFIVFFILNRKLGGPLQMLIVTIVALLIGFAGGGFMLRRTSSSAAR